MADTTTQLNVRLVLRNDTAENWKKSTLVPLKGELCVETDKKLFKIGNGVDDYNTLTYANMTPEEISDIIGNGVVHDVKLETGSTNGTVKITVNGTSAEVAVKGLGSAAYTGSSAYAAAGHSHDNRYYTENEIDTKVSAINTSISTQVGTVQSKLDTHTGNSNIHVTAEDKEKWNAKQAAITIDSTLSTTSTNPIQNKPVATALNTKASLASPTFTGTPKAPTASQGNNSTQIATTEYVDTAVKSGLQTADSMTLKGTLGTDGTITALPTKGIVQGDTYKVISSATIASTVSYSGAEEKAKFGDLIVAMGNSKWLLVPSGDESETFIKYAKSGVNLSTSAQSGTVIVGEAAIKQVDTNISAASTSANLPTAAAVATFVEGKGYKTTDNKVTNTLNTTTKAYITGTTSATTNTGGQVFDTGVYLDTAAGQLTATTFKGALSGKATSAGTADSASACTGNSATATKFKTARTISTSGGAVGTSGNFDGSGNATIAVTSLNTDYLQNGSKQIILDCGGSSI